MANEKVRRVSVNLPMSVYSTLESIKKGFEKSNQKMTISDVINFCLIDYINRLAKDLNNANMEQIKETNK